MLTPLPLSSPRGPGANERRPVGLVPAMRTQQENLWRSYPARHAHLPGSRGKRRKARPLAQRAARRAARVVERPQAAEQLVSAPLPSLRGRMRFASLPRKSRTPRSASGFPRHCKMRSRLYREMIPTRRH